MRIVKMKWKALIQPINRTGKRHITQTIEVSGKGHSTKQSTRLQQKKRGLLLFLEKADICR